MFTINFCKVNTNYFNHCKTISYNTFMLKNTERLNICQHFKHQEFSSKNNRETRKKCDSALGKNKKFKHISIFLCNINAIFQKFLKLSRNTMALNVFIKLCQKFM